MFKVQNGYNQISRYVNDPKYVKKNEIFIILAWVLLGDLNFE